MANVGQEARTIGFRSVFYWCFPGAGGGAQQDIINSPKAILISNAKRERRDKNLRKRGRRRKGEDYLQGLEPHRRPLGDLIKRLLTFGVKPKKAPGRRGGEPPLFVQEKNDLNRPGTDRMQLIELLGERGVSDPYPRP